MTAVIREQGTATQYYLYHQGMLCPMCGCRLAADTACKACGYDHVVDLLDHGKPYRAKVAKRFEAVCYE